MNPETNKFESLSIKPESDFQNGLDIRKTSLARPNGDPIPKHWSIFQLDENVVVKDYTFKVAYIGETAILLEPVSPVILENK